MMDKSNVFELVLIGGARGNRFTAFVPKGEQGRAAEHDFEWRVDSTGLAMDLGDLARAASTGLNRVDFATPALFLSDPGCLQVDPTAGREGPAEIARDLSGVAMAQRFVGHSSELRTLQSQLDPERGAWRAVIVHGLGGMGKTARQKETCRLQSQVVHKSRPQPGPIPWSFDGV